MLDHRHRAGDPPIVHISREIPLPWLVGIVAGLLIQGVTLYIGQQQQADAIKALTADIRELRAVASSAGLKQVEYGLRIDDHERRLQTIEGRAAGQERPR